MKPRDWEEIEELSKRTVREILDNYEIELKGGIR